MKNLLKVSGVALLMALLVAACGPTAATPTEEATTAPTEEATAAPTEEATAEAPYEGVTVTSPDCEQGGASPIKEISAVDRLTVKFTLCQPDPAFLSKVAFTSFAIQPAEHLQDTGGTGDLLDHPVGTGPYMLDSWNRGESVVMKRFDDYWGDKAIAGTLVFRWNSEAAARLLELQSGTVDGIDNPGPDDYAAIQGDSSLQLLERPALNTMYLGMTDTFDPWSNPDVRKALAMGIDRQRIVDTFYPKGSEVATHFTPCAIPNGCTGDDWYDFDAAAAKQLLSDAGFPDGFSTKLYYRNVVRGYLPDPKSVAEDLQAQLKDNLNITVEVVEMESGAFIEASTTGKLEGLYLLGWGADYPHITNFLDFHFSEGNPQFGTPHPEIFDALKQGSQVADPAAAADIYTTANNAIRDLVPMVPIAHGGNGVAYRADVTGAHASPLGNEYFAVMDPGGRDTFVWMQNAEPISLFCGDESDGESLRACEQITEALLAYKVGGTDVVPALATGCEPNEDLSVWTCTLRDGVKFHDGSDFDANDVVASWALEWDASNPLHVGNSGAFEYMANLFGLINVPPATPSP